MGEVMPLTPEDVSNKRFTPVRLREGYDMGEVDQFLDEVEAELARLTKENDDLRAKLSAAQSSGGASAPVETPAPAPVVEKTPEPEPTPAPVAAPVAAAPAAGAIETIRVETVPEASNAAARLLELATRNHDALIDQAKNDADKMESDARTRASMLDSETAARRQQLFGDLEREKDKLTTEVEGLRSFEREYRSRLKSYFTQQLEALNTTPETPGQSGNEDAPAAPKRLRSILGEEEG